MSEASDTRLALLLAAERLFGEHGLDAVSLRQINSSAAQRNTSAAHYHFGSKEALVRAVLDHRLERMNERRSRMLDDLERTGRMREVRALVAAVVHPMMEEAFADESGRHYLRFLAQVATHPNGDLRSLASSRHASSLRRVHRELRAALAHLPDVVFSMRFGLMFLQVTHGIADIDKLRSAMRRVGSCSVPAYASILCDLIAGSLSAPISAETLAQLGAERSAVR